MSGLEKGRASRQVAAMECDAADTPREQHASIQHVTTSEGASFVAVWQLDMISKIRDCGGGSTTRPGVVSVPRRAFGVLPPTSQMEKGVPVKMAQENPTKVAVIDEGKLIERSWSPGKLFCLGGVFF
jgi:hypothetical protein